MFLVYLYLFFNFQVASVFYYLCVVTLQCLLPILLTLVLAVMLKTLGECTVHN